MSSTIESSTGATPFFYTGSVVGPEGQEGHFAATGIHQEAAPAAIPTLADVSGGNYETSEDTGVMAMPVPPAEVALVHALLAARGNVVQSLPFGMDVAEERLGLDAVDRILHR